MHNSMKSDNVTACDVLSEAGIHKTNAKSQTNMIFWEKED